MRGLSGKVAIVSGTTQTMGIAIAERLVEEGVSVVGCGRSADRGEAAASAVREKGGAMIFTPADLSREEAVRAVVDLAIETHGRIDIVVNNAAAIDHIRGGGEKPPVEEENSAFERHLGVGLYAPFWFAKYVVPHMREQGGGAFVQISSLASIRGSSGMPAYASSKAALEAFSRQLATAYAPDNIRSNVVRVGAIQVEQNRRLHEHPIAGPAMRENQMLQRSGMPTDIAAATAFLASDESGFITAVAINVDGGAAYKTHVPDVSAIYAAMGESG